MARHHGKNGSVLMSTTGTGVPVKVGSLDAWDLDMSTDKEPTTSFGDHNKQSVQGFPDYKGTFGGNWDDTVSTPWTGRGSSDGVILYLYPDETNSPTKYAWGPAWVDMKIATSATGKVTINGTYEANGDWDDSL
jgi:hypothetical protein